MSEEISLLKRWYLGVKNSNKKSMGYIIIIIGIGLAIIIVSNLLLPEEEKVRDNSVVRQIYAQASTEKEMNFRLEQRLAKILAEIRGVGKVSVLVTYSTGIQSIYAKDEKTTVNTTSERDNTGGERKVSENQGEESMVFEDNQNGKKTPIILRQEAAEVRGVIIAAEGGDDSSVKMDITRAVESALGVSKDRIQVFKIR